MEHVFVIGTTNRPDLLDPSLLRPGRFDMLVYIPPPDEEARLKILRIFTRNMPLAEDVSLEEIARATDRFTGADLKSLCREAGLLAMKEGRDKVMMKDFMAALRQVHPTFTPTLERWYESIKENIQSKMMGKGPKTLYG